MGARPHFFFFFIFFGKNVHFNKKNFFFRSFFFGEKMCECVGACKNWCVGACAAYHENVCDVRVGADENPSTKGLPIS